MDVLLIIGISIVGICFMSELNGISNEIFLIRQRLEWLHEDYQKVNKLGKWEES